MSSWALVSIMLSAWIIYGFVIYFAATVFSQHLILLIIDLVNSVIFHRFLPFALNVQFPLPIIGPLIIYGMIIPVYCLSCFGENLALKTHIDLLGLFLVFRGSEGRSVAAVDGLGNEPLALGVPLILEVIKHFN